MNTSSRVPGLSRNSGWQAVDAKIAARRLYHQQNGTAYGAAPGPREVASTADLRGLWDDKA